MGFRQIAPAIPVISVSGYDEAQVMGGDHGERPDLFLHKLSEFKVPLAAIHRLTAAHGFNHFPAR